MNGEPRHTIAVDFGTSNTYISRCPADELLPSPVSFAPGQVGTETALLYRQGQTPLVGSRALETWADASAEERRGYRLRILFKPEITADAEASQWALDFLRGLRNAALQTGADLDGGSKEIYFGVPGEADAAFRTALASIAGEAGFGEVRTVEEPVGALLSHLSRRDIAPSEALRGVLVVDFGGGTCDFAYMQRLDIRHAWGDLRLGGRLFDDLFYQLLLRRNPGLEARLAGEGASSFVQWYLCRRMKEAFSSSMSRDRAEAWSGRAGRYATLENLSWEAFLEAASDYRPSDTLRELLAHTPGGKVLPGTPVDLICWFRDCLLEGLERHQIRSADIEKVLLSGGSSLWPFVPEVIREALHLAPSQLLRSDQPYAVVAEGLSLLPALKRRHRQVSARLNNSLPRFLASLKEEVIAVRAGDMAREIADDLTGSIYRRRIAPAVRAFRQEGGTIQGLRTRVEKRLQEAAAEIESAFSQRTEELAVVLSGEIRSATARWFAENGVGSLPPHLTSVSEGSRHPVQSGRFAFSGRDLTNELVGLFEGIGALLVGGVTASICGGSGMALIMSGPVGLVIGGIGGIIVYALGRRNLHALPLHPWITRGILPEWRVEQVLDKGERRFRETVEELVLDLWREQEDRYLDELAGIIRSEIDSLTAINQIGADR
ncbi:MAG: hypothetical protein K9L28_03035 [Synergistales bacterium]|nr:hypothetical protein [Synergistales bacterium]